MLATVKPVMIGNWELQSDMTDPSGWGGRKRRIVAGAARKAMGGARRGAGTVPGYDSVPQHRQLAGHQRDRHAAHFTVVQRQHQRGGVVGGREYAGAAVVERHANAAE